jgi:hypothetical protein
VDRENKMTIDEARLVLGVSKQPMAALISSGALVTFANPLDGRSELASAADVFSLRDESIPPNSHECEVTLWWKQNDDGVRSVVQRLVSRRVVGVGTNLTEKYVVLEAFQFDLGRLPEHDLGELEFDHAMITMALPGDSYQHRGVVLGEIDSLPGWYDPMAEHQLVHVIVEYAPDGTPSRAQFRTPPAR